MMPMVQWDVKIGARDGDAGYAWWRHRVAPVAAWVAPVAAGSHRWRPGSHRWPLGRTGGRWVAPVAAGGTTCSY